MEKELWEAVRSYQLGKSEFALILLKTFEPLLKKYSGFLHTEDALEELQCCLLFVLKNLQLSKLSSCTDGVIISYAQSAIYHHYIAFSKNVEEEKNTLSAEELNQHDSVCCALRGSSCDYYEQLVRSDVQNILSEKEYKVIRAIYYEGYTVAEAAAKFGKTRQTINRIKKSALDKLRIGW